MTAPSPLGWRQPTVQRSAEACARCGSDPAAGFAGVGDERYCHGDLTAPFSVAFAPGAQPTVQGPAKLSDNSIVCIDCGAVQTHRVCAECFLEPPAPSGDPQGGSGAHGGAKRHDPTYLHGGGRAWVECSCGYESPNFRGQAGAQAAYARHLVPIAPDPGGLHGAYGADDALVEEP